MRGGVSSRGMFDPASFQLLPWRPKEQAIVRMICDVQAPRQQRPAARVCGIAVG